MNSFNTSDSYYVSLQIRKNFSVVPSSKSITRSYSAYSVSFLLSRPYSLLYFQNLFSTFLMFPQVSSFVTLTQYYTTLVISRLQFFRVPLISTYPIIQSIFRLYSYNYSIPKITSSFPNSKMSNNIITSFPLILSYIGPVSILIILLPQLIGSPTIVTNR